MEDIFNYCVAIRTLGTAGEKYQTLLDSLNAQTIPAKKILVYIAEGYELPKETIGIEEYVQCPKGMIAQRSLPFDGVDTEYVLFCDDDLYLPPDFVERMYQGLMSLKGDCIAANVYNEEQMSFIGKLGIFLHSFITPHHNDGCNIHIKRNASYSYNQSPKSDYLRTESAPGASFLCKLSAYKSIHFENERWLDKMSYAAGDDQLFFYKMHLMGFKVGMYRNSGVVHLDAQAGQRPTKANKMYLQKKNLFIMWYRTIYNIRSKNSFEKCRCISAFAWRCLFGVFTLPLEVIHYKQPRFFIDYFRGLLSGYRYVQSEEYKAIPPFDAYLY
jgi:GT2 family glycosyltransferase